MLEQAVRPQILHTPTYRNHAGQCDCGPACVLNPPHRDAVLPPAEPLITQIPLYPMSIEGEWQVTFNPAGPAGVVALNAAARRVLGLFSVPTCVDRLPAQMLDLPPAEAQEAAHTLAHAGLLRPLVVPSAPAATSPILSAWLHVSEACNLHCPYCYVPNRPRTAGLDVEQRAIDRLVQAAVRHHYTTLQLKYAGGEPTLKLPVVWAAHDHAIRRTAEAGLELREVLLTNGVDLSDAALDRVAAAGMRLVVSLDGGPAHHDQTRSRADGSRTYDSVVKTIDGAVARGLRADISITLTALNLGGVPEAVAFALSRHLPFSLNFYRECHTGQKMARAVLSHLQPDSNRLVEVVGQAMALAGQHPSYPLPLTGILDRARLDLPHMYPCSAGHDYLAVDPRGRVAACQMLLEEPWTDLDDADPLTTVRRHGEDIFKSVLDRPDCRYCQWQTACSGGCPLLRETPLHRSYCRVYRTLLPELVRLEGKRLIASAGRPPAS